MNCIIAQSGGPTSVINASVVGLVEGNFEKNIFKNVYGGLNGIEGILKGNIINLSKMSKVELDTFKHTPSSGLGSCRYKLKDYKIDETDYIKLIDILNSLNIKAFFYIGGNDSMDTTNKLSAFAKEKNIDIQFIGIPKTIDNDLVFTDHTPGFGSAAKFIATSTLEAYLDSTVYTNNGIFILETMGRDTGWLAASTALATIEGKQVADFIYLPEVPFSEEQFILDVKSRFKEKNHVFIVASEGIKNKYGDFLGSINDNTTHDSFGHAQLGGVANYLKNLIIQSKVTNRVKTLELGVLQRCALHCSSKTDFEEASMVGKAALNYVSSGYSGYMVGIKRDTNTPYKSSTFLVEANKVANKVKYFPKEWINPKGNNITKDALLYLKPLISQLNQLNFYDYLPKYKVFNR
ncbi:6-phosphofructokinase [Clostridium fallax]|uniref:Pyrophosphate--fructose 6-phosphate 1-phosphotransferase n=1 Tax=Clostridium fallax TaxID=1533 RepID=A0A1M4VU19_9CLOT|nr:6-phosphofructokinase [Clostridium fallax]SHE72345.1 6-phosphofructokinase [Clostridium fallax]SQB07688.1 6-phosphofructokinase [Clostridium fallax]